jgi:hypothetical protein
LGRQTGDYLLKQGTELVESPFRKVIVFGPSKNGGKTTFALSATGNRKLLLQYSPGTVSIPPGVDPASIWVKQYDFDADVMSPTTDKWKRTREPYSVMEDIDAIVTGFHKGGPVVLDGKEIDLPDVIVMDDGVLFHDYIVAWICAVNNISDPQDWKQWGKRTQIMISLLRRAFKLPCTVIFTTWETIDKGVDGQVSERWPDIGGKLDYRAVGLADAGLYAYSVKEGQQVHFKIRTKSNGIIQGCGVRGKYDLPEVIDVTLTKPGDPLPWTRVWDGPR